MADRSRERTAARDADVSNVPASDRPRAVDAGKTGGGGSSGHDQPDDITRVAPIRNQPGESRDQVSLRDRQPPDPLPEERS